MPLNANLLKTESLNSADVASVLLNRMTKKAELKDKCVSTRVLFVCSVWFK